MPKLYSITIRWAETQLTQTVIDAVDQTINPLGDWMRFHAYTWLLFTENDAPTIRTTLLPIIKSNDNLLVVRADPTDVDGWAQPWVWEWIRKAR